MWDFLDDLHGDYWDNHFVPLKIFFYTKYERNKRQEQEQKRDKNKNKNKTKTQTRTQQDANKSETSMKLTLIDMLVRGQKKGKKEDLQPGKCKIGLQTYEY